VQSVFRVTHELAWRLGLVILIYGVLSWMETLMETLDATGPNGGGLRTVRFVWAWKSVAIWTVGAVAFGRQVIRWIRAA
jgi:hypothetical protein